MGVRKREERRRLRTKTSLSGGVRQRAMMSPCPGRKRKSTNGGLKLKLRGGSRLEREKALLGHEVIGENRKLV